MMTSARVFEIDLIPIIVIGLFIIGIVWWYMRLGIRERRLSIEANQRVWAAARELAAANDSVIAELAAHESLVLPQSLQDEIYAAHEQWNAAQNRNRGREIS